MIDTSQNFKVERKAMPVEAQIMHREKNIIVVRADKGAQGTVIQVSFDLN
jgi:hypothetical protein